MEKGIISEAAVDTLLGYAYMQPGVLKVAIQINLDEKNEGKNPEINYKVQLFWKTRIKHKLATRFNKAGIFNKVMVLFLVKIVGAPAPGIIEYYINGYAKAFLPGKYKVNVEIL